MKTSPTKRRIVPSFLMGLVVLLLALAQGGPWPALAAIGRGIGLARPAAEERLAADVLPLDVWATPALPTATASATATAARGGRGVTPTLPGATPTRSTVGATPSAPGKPAVDATFASYYATYDGARLLGAPLTAALMDDGRRVQYFERGKLEDHRQASADPVWQFSYGLLGEELVRLGASLPVGGEMSTVTYATLRRMVAESQRHGPPKGYTGAPYKNKDSSVFIPFSADLQAAPGHNVAAIFWVVLASETRSPGGWLHDVGLPLTEPVWATVDKGEQKGRRLLIQAFQRTILTYDALNTPGWQVERANIGADWLALHPELR